MSVEVEIAYTGDLRCRAVHAPSGKGFATEAPVDNGGKGEEFSPTDLVGTALGTCILTIMGIIARRHSLDLTGTTARVVKEMAAAPARRIGSLAVDITLPPGRSWSEEDRRRLEAAAATCPVKLSLHPDVVVTVAFHYPSGA